MSIEYIYSALRLMLKTAVDRILTFPEDLGAAHNITRAYQLVIGLRCQKKLAYLFVDCHLNKEMKIYL